MSAATVIEQFAATRAQLDSVCDLLRSPSPDSLDSCATIFASAVSRMLDCQSSIPEAHGDAAAMAAAWDVRRSFQKAGRLLENASRFHGGWTSVRGAMTGGYTNRGEAAPVLHT